MLSFFKQFMDLTDSSNSSTLFNKFLLNSGSEDLTSFELVWHRDKEDRYVEAMHDTDWKFQYDNDLPVDLSNKKLFIPKETYHRLIKGTGDLTLKIFILLLMLTLFKIIDMLERLIRN